MKRLVSFFDRFNNQLSLEEANIEFTKIINEVVGYENVVLGPVTPTARRILIQTAEVQKTESGRPVVLHTCPQEWVNYYFAQNYYNTDPLIFQSRYRSSPISWDLYTKNKHLPPDQKKLFGERSEHGLRSGITIPIHGPNNESYMLSLSTKYDNFTSDVSVSDLQVLALQYHTVYSQFAKSSKLPQHKSPITGRERECLAWASTGMNPSEIGDILNISDNTVNFHLKNSIKKLGTTNRTAAVIKAIYLGLVEL